jgi:hypothetical protein
VAVRHLLRRVGIGIGRAKLDSGQVGGQPPSHLRRGDREGGQRAHVGGGKTLFDDDAEGHIQRQLGKHLQRRPDRQAVQGGRHRTVDRILDRHAGVSGRAVADGIESSGRAVDRETPHGIRAVLRNHAGVDHLQQRRIGEGPFGAEIRDACHW